MKEKNQHMFKKFHEDYFSIWLLLLIFVAFCYIWSQNHGVSGKRHRYHRGMTFQRHLSICYTKLQTHWLKMSIVPKGGPKMPILCLRCPLAVSTADLDFEYWQGRHSVYWFWIISLSFLWFKCDFYRIIFILQTNLNSIGVVWRLDDRQTDSHPKKIKYYTYKCTRQVIHESILAFDV